MTFQFDLIEMKTQTLFLMFLHFSFKKLRWHAFHVYFLPLQIVSVAEDEAVNSAIILNKERPVRYLLPPSRRLSASKTKWVAQQIHLEQR